MGSANAGEIGRCSFRAQEHAEVLASIAAHCINVSSAIFADATSEELTRRAHALR